MKNILGFAAVFVMRCMEGVTQCVTLRRVALHPWRDCHGPLTNRKKHRTIYQ